MIMLGCPVRTNQIQFSLLDRRAETSGMLDLAKRFRIKLLCFGCVAGGWLSERFLGMEKDPMPRWDRKTLSKKMSERRCTVSLRKYRQGLDLWTNSDKENWKFFQELLRVLDGIAKRKTEELRQKMRMQMPNGASRVGGRYSNKLSPESLEEEDDEELSFLLSADGSPDNIFGSNNINKAAKERKNTEEEEQKTVRISIANVAAKWVLEKLDREAYGGAIIIGARDSRHLPENKMLLRESEWGLNDSDMEEINEVFRRVKRCRYHSIADAKQRMLDSVRAEASSSSIRGRSVTMKSTAMTTTSTSTSASTTAEQEPYRTPTAAELMKTATIGVARFLHLIPVSEGGTMPDPPKEDHLPPLKEDQSSIKKKSPPGGSPRQGGAGSASPRFDMKMTSPGSTLTSSLGSPEANSPFFGKADPAAMNETVSTMASSGGMADIAQQQSGPGVVGRKRVTTLGPRDATASGPTSEAGTGFRGGGGAPKRGARGRGKRGSKGAAPQLPAVEEATGPTAEEIALKKLKERMQYVDAQEKDQKVMDRERFPISTHEREVLLKLERERDNFRTESKAFAKEEYEEFLRKEFEAGRDLEAQRQQEAKERNELRRAQIQMGTLQKMVNKKGVKAVFGL
ncbi:unnamed protein product [Amoebophrya sp. A25]|nr:unnamed protein product [Amoebophrya sp. A25]|eukprot:GSA25T00010537001.1